MRARREEISRSYHRKLMLLFYGKCGCGRPLFSLTNCELCLSKTRERKRRQRGYKGRQTRPTTEQRLKTILNRR